MRSLLLSWILFLIPLCTAQDQGQAPTVPAPSAATPVRSSFQVRYINGSNVYIDGGRDAGLTEGMALLLKQDPTKPATDPSNNSIEPGIVAKLTVVAVASTSAVL